MSAVQNFSVQGGLPFALFKGWAALPSDNPVPATALPQTPVQAAVDSNPNPPAGDNARQTSESTTTEMSSSRPAG
jgi:hypothetical protein